MMILILYSLCSGGADVRDTHNIGLGRQRGTKGMEEWSLCRGVLYAIH